MAKRVVQDKYFKLAKEEGYVARSAYKLKQLEERFDLIQPGGRVLDLGCAPGSWMQVASELLGEEGTLVGVDLKPIELEFHCRYISVVGDINTIDPSQLTEFAGGLFDTVLSDIAPNTAGRGDDLRSAHLCRQVLQIAEQVLRPGGRLTMKIFDGAEFQSVLLETRDRFMQAKTFKPKATREVSRETFIIARGFKGIGNKP